MIRFLKALFGVREPDIPAQSSTTVDLSNLVAWFTEARAPMHAQLSECITLARTRLEPLANTVREKISTLQTAQLMNTNIPERAKDIMEGNREEYARRVLNYLDMLALPAAREALPSFFSQHERDARDFTQGILRPFQILQEFFAHETKEITVLLAEIEQEVISLRSKYEQVRPGAEYEINHLIDLLLAKQQKQHQLEQEQAALEHHCTEATTAIVALNSEEERLLKDAERKAALQKLAEAQQRTRAHEGKIRAAFQQFEPALRKFHRMATRNVALVERYLKDPVAALIEDLKIDDFLEVISDIKRLLGFDRLSLGEKRASVLAALPLMSREFLGVWMREYGQLARAEKDAQRAVDECEASKTLLRIQRLREETRRNNQLAEQRLVLIRKDLENIKLNEIKTQLEQQLSQLTGITVTVSLA
jgi:hypothetical protein